MRFHVSFSHHALARAEAADARTSAEQPATAPPAADAPETAAALRRLVTLARAADAGGAEAIWITEDPDGWDAFAIATLVATATQRVHIGTGVTSPLMRHPNLIAASLATLDIVSGGRAFLGIGRGEPDWYRNGLGMDVPSPFAALDRAITLIRQWQAPSHRVVAGARHRPEHPFPVRDWERTILPLPRNSSQPPIHVAAAGPRALDLAGRLADGVLFNDMASDDYLRDAVRLVRQSANVAGRDHGALRFHYGTPVEITDDPEASLWRRTAILTLVNALPGMDRQLRHPGFGTDRIIAEVRRLMRTDDMLADGGGFPAIRRGGDLAAARRVIPLALVDALSVVGNLHHVRHRLVMLSEIGITDVFVALPHPTHDPWALREALERLRSLMTP